MTLEKAVFTPLRKNPRFNAMQAQWCMFVSILARDKEKRGNTLVLKTLEVFWVTARNPHEELIL